MQGFIQFPGGLNNNNRPMKLVSKNNTKELRQQRPDGSKVRRVELRANPMNERVIDVSEMVNTPPSQGRPDRRRKNKSGGDSSSSSSDDFNREVNRGYFFDDGKSSCVDFSYPVLSTLHSKTISTPTTLLATNEYFHNPKYEVSICSFYRNNKSAGYTAMMSEIFYRLSRKIVKDNRSPVFSSWTGSAFYSYVDLMIRALSLYYSVDSILSYKGINGTRNDAVTRHQTHLEASFEIISKQNELRRLLRGFCFPGKYANLIRWTFQLYKSADLDQATNYRYVPVPQLIWTTTNKDIIPALSAIYDNILSSMEDPDKANIAGILARSYPEWEINGLPLSCSEAVYDSTHHEMWVNQPLIYFTNDPTGGTEVYPNATFFQNKPIPWASNKQNGQSNVLPYALNPTYKTDQWTESAESSGMLLPIRNTTEVAASRQGNFLVWYHEDGRFEPVTATSSSRDLDTTGLVHNCGYNATISGDVYSSIPPGFQPKYFLIPDSPIVELRTLMGWLFNVPY